MHRHRLLLIGGDEGVRTCVGLFTGRVLGHVFINRNRQSWRISKTQLEAILEIEETGDWFRMTNIARGVIDAGEVLREAAKSRHPAFGRG